MNERAAQMILLARAFEEADRDGTVLPLEQRMAATRRAIIVTTRDGGDGEFSRDVIVPSEETMLRRARLIHEALRRRIPSIDRVLELSRLRSLMGPAVVFIAFVAGIFTNALGPQRHINLLALPLMGLLLWNIGIYLVMFGLCLVRRQLALRGKGEGCDTGPRSRDRLVSGLADGVVRFALWRSHWGWQKRSRAPKRQVQVTSRAFIRYSALWHRLTGSLLESRVRRRLHLGAAALMAGVVAGMYLRGIAFEYRATWESTLLSADRVQWLLNLVMAPATWVLGVSVPDVAPLRSPGGGDAAIWIHLYALTALFVVGIPRLSLAAVELWRGHRLKSAISLDLHDGYFRRLLADWRGSAKHVVILPYSFRPTAHTLDVMKSLFHDFFGARAHIEVRDSLEYGQPPGDMPAWFLDHTDETDLRYVVVLFSLAQSPEIEVHGQLLEQLKGQLENCQGKLLVLVDRSTYKKATSEARCEERMRAWTRVVESSGITVVELDPSKAALDYRVADERMAAFRQALWPYANPAGMA